MANIEKPGLEPGMVLSGTYEIVRRIGAGGMGAVYEARHLRLAGRRVAIKVLLADFASDAESFARFRREAEIGARLGHPHIIQVTDWDKLPDGAPFMVMEMLDGDDLHQRMSRGRLSEELVYRILRETGSALAAAHKQGIVHRDLKPHNIFLVNVDAMEGATEQVKVLDFGISKVAASQTLKTRDSAVLGTPRYMAPEQALGKNEEIDGRTDEFALATVAYELFAGQPAFDADSATAVLFKVVYEAPTPLSIVAPHISAGVAAAVARGMEKSPAARFTDVAGFIGALLEGARGSPLAPAQRAPAPVFPASRRSFFFMIGAGLAATGAGLALVLSFARPPHRTPPPVPAPVVQPQPAQPVPAGTERPARPDPPAVPTAPTEIAVPHAEPSPDLHGPQKEKKTVRPSEKPDVASVLDEAEALLTSGDWSGAVRTAQQALLLQEVPRARRIMALSYCGMNDLGMARAALYKVAGGDRRQVLKRCRKLGLNL